MRIVLLYAATFAVGTALLTLMFAERHQTRGCFAIAQAFALGCGR